MKEPNNVTFIKDEINDDYSNDDLFNIISWGADLSIAELIRLYDIGSLLKPKLQRNYIWDKIEASRFIDSILLGLPVPSIFLSNTTENRRLIIDGFQRIMTLFNYVKLGIFEKDKKVFKLIKSNKINERWRGKSFKELNSTEQRKIENTTIHAIIFEQKEPKNDTSLYQIFERINTGGRILRSQEIRNCVYQGLFNDLIVDLNLLPNWRALYGLNDPDPRMLDQEFILRFFALSSPNLINSKTTQISLKKFLNEFMGSEDSRNNDILNSRKIEFTNTINYIFENIGKDAFHNLSAQNVSINKFHPTIFDSIAIATKIALSKDNPIDVSNIKEKRINLLKDADYKVYTTSRTTNVDHIVGRIKIALKYLYNYNYE